MSYAFIRTMVQTRSRGHTAVGAICYRFGLAGRSTFPGARNGEHDGRMYDYSRRRGIAASGSALPDCAHRAWKNPLEWARRVEAVERRSNSRLCRDDVIGIPVEMIESGVAQKALQAYAGRLAAAHRTPVHYALHKPERGGRNWHAHVLYGGRRLDSPDRFSAKRDREQDKFSLIDLHRKFWTEICAEYGVELDWTKRTTQIHVGPKAVAVERHEIVSELSQKARDAAPELDAETRLDVAEIAIGGITVTEMLALDRDPKTRRMRRCKFPDINLDVEREIPPGPVLRPPERALSEVLTPLAELAPPTSPVRREVPPEPVFTPPQRVLSKMLTPLAELAPPTPLVRREVPPLPDLAPPMRIVARIMARLPLLGLPLRSLTRHASALPTLASPDRRSSLPPPSAPTKTDARMAGAYLQGAVGACPRPSLQHEIERIAVARLRGKGFAEESHIVHALRPRVDASGDDVPLARFNASNQAPVRSQESARTAARILTEETPLPPSPEAYEAFTKSGRERLRQRAIETALWLWDQRRQVVLDRIIKAILPSEIAAWQRQLRLQFQLDAKAPFKQAGRQNQSIEHDPTTGSAAQRGKGQNE